MPDAAKRRGAKPGAKPGPVLATPTRGTMKRRYTVQFNDEITTRVIGEAAKDRVPVATWLRNVVIERLNGEQAQSDT